ncbi:MAG: phosphatidate cytidylyltransferase [Bryobacteraceae bacterium]|nr:phosphatidate cytidylyltransferase [Bryobacteraceae bacterium]
MKRVITALVLIPAVSWVIFLAPYPVFWIVVAAFAALCYREYTRLVRESGYEPFAVPGYAIGLLLLAGIGETLALLPMLTAVAGLALALRNDDLKHALPSAGAFALGVFYIFGAWNAALVLWRIHPGWLFFAVALNWAGDIAAFYVGRAMGKRKLAPIVSPGKSWEGAIASALAAMIFGGVLLHYVDPLFAPWKAVALAFAGNVAGQLGDLAESALKRGAGVKDSGTMLPGHGGWLDRLDSSLFSMPVVAALLSLLRG